MTKQDPTPITAKWRDHKQYKCRLCSFDTLDKKKFEKHFAEMHPPLQVISGGREDASNRIEDMTRDELNQVAVKAGVQGVEAFSTKADVIAAIEAVQKGSE